LLLREIVAEGSGVNDRLPDVLPNLIDEGFEGVPSGDLDHAGKVFRSLDISAEPIKAVCNS
jgi:hypothetical protein